MSLYSPDAYAPLFVHSVGDLHLRFLSLNDGLASESQNLSPLTQQCFPFFDGLAL
jgi:hypothetical protein